MPNHQLQQHVQKEVILPSLSASHHAYWGPRFILRSVMRSTQTQGQTTWAHTWLNVQSWTEHWVFLCLFPHLKTEDNNRLSWGLNKVKDTKSSEWHQLLYCRVPWLGSLVLLPSDSPKQILAGGLDQPFCITYYTYDPTHGPCSPQCAPQAVTGHILLYCNTMLLSLSILSYY